MNSRQLAEQQLAERKLQELTEKLSYELKSIFPSHHPEKLLQEQRIFLLSVQVNALKSNINFKNTQ